MENRKALAAQEISSAEAQGLPAGDTLVVWPVASLEQHGPHLPLGTDALILQAVVEGARQMLGMNFPALFLPLQAYGKSPEHLSFAGTVSLSTPTLLGICEDVVSSLAAHGFRLFVFLNGHGGNTGLLQSFGYDLRQKYRVRIYNLDLWASSFFDEIIAQEFPDLVGKEVHAASVETAVMMHLYPELVGELSQSDLKRSLDDPVHFSWSSEDFKSAGVIGDPTQATPEKGEVILRLAVEKTARLIREIAKDEKD